MTNERRVSFTEPVDVFMMETSDPQRIPEGVTVPSFYKVSLFSSTNLFLLSHLVQINVTWQL